VEFWSLQKKGGSQRTIRVRQTLGRSAARGRCCHVAGGARCSASPHRRRPPRSNVGKGPSGGGPPAAPPHRTGRHGARAPGAPVGPLWEKTQDRTRITGAVTDPFSRDRNPGKTRIHGTLIGSQSPRRTAYSSAVPRHNPYQYSCSVTTFSTVDIFIETICKGHEGRRRPRPRSPTATIYHPQMHRHIIRAKTELRPCLEGEHMWTRSTQIWHPSPVFRSAGVGVVLTAQQKCSKIGWKRDRWKPATRSRLLWNRREPWPQAPNQWRSSISAPVVWCLVLLIPEVCPGGQRQRLTVNTSTLLVWNDSKKASKPIESPHSVAGPCI